ERARKRSGRLDAVVQVSGVTGPKSDEVTGPKSDDLHPAVRRLLSELDQLLSELQRASSAVPASPKNERERYIHILVALGQFVRKVGGTLEQVRHIAELAWHLADLDRGIVSPVLIHQQVNVTQGGQAVVAGDKVMSRTRGRRASDGGG